MYWWSTEFRIVHGSKSNYNEHIYLGNCINVIRKEEHQLFNALKVWDFSAPSPNPCKL